MASPLVYLFLTFLTFFLPTTPQVEASAPSGHLFSKPNCSSTCGNLNIPYPFGTRKGCYLDSLDNSFLITCKGKVPYLGKSRIKVLNILLIDQNIRILRHTTPTCHNKSRNSTDTIASRLRLSKFTVNDTRNKFIVTGCSTLGYIRGSTAENIFTTSACSSACEPVDNVMNGSCSGIGCCQTSLPKGVRDFAELGLIFINETASACSSAFVVEEGAYSFSSLDLSTTRRRSYPIMLDWAVGNETCASAKKNKTNYLCVAPGSIYIDECKRSNPCDAPAKCQNQHGGVSCVCPPSYKSDGKGGCVKVSHGGPIAHRIAIGISVSLFVLVVGSSWIYRQLANIKHTKQKQKLFMQNGGLTLREELSKDDSLANTVKLFTEEDIRKATNNFDEHGIIGRGGCGTVHKGVISPNNKSVAVKKSKVSEQSQISQFINEMIILSRINHINVVRLIGCCLETQVPLLVYEFMSNGTLSDHIHKKVTGSYLSWECCLRIAAEIAEAIAYLHSAASPPIIHRDIKSTNILLDENLVAKVADFGASKIVPRDHKEIATLVQGTFGYIDPEYFHSGELTEKSDVYSFGVLLAELLTGEHAVSFNRPDEERCLAVYFLASVKHDNGLPSIIRKSFIEDGKNLEQIKQVVVMAARCLKVTGNQRPGMRELAMELERLKTTVAPPWPDQTPARNSNNQISMLSKADSDFSSITEFADLSFEMTRKVGQE
ncbi:hypothetical protein ACET3Z_030664 [Daucus carota]